MMTSRNYMCPSPINSNKILIHIWLNELKICHIICLFFIDSPKTEWFCFYLAMASQYHFVYFDFKACFGDTFSNYYLIDMYNRWFLCAISCSNLNAKMFDSKSMTANVIHGTTRELIKPTCHLINRIGKW